MTCQREFFAKVHVDIDSSYAPSSLSGRRFTLGLTWKSASDIRFACSFNSQVHCTYRQCVASAAVYDH